jgi:hypothetical protein
MVVISDVSLEAVDVASSWVAGPVQAKMLLASKMNMADRMNFWHSWSEENLGMYHMLRTYL